MSLQKRETTFYVLWDLMGTLIHDPFFKEYFAQLDQPVSTWMKNRDKMAWVDFELGKIDEQTFYKRIFPEDLEKGKEMKSIFLQNYRFLPGAHEILQRLKFEGVPSYVLSNYPIWYKEMFEQLNLKPYFEEVFVSCDIGLRKPDARLYQHVLDQLECQPHEFIFFDDRQINCQAAESLGIQAIHVSETTCFEDILFGNTLIPKQ
tara:strand:- start:134 stop:745 length:612 start_codon:yes stop_codon:yes gene_type:complete